MAADAAAAEIAAATAINAVRLLSTTAAAAALLSRDNCDMAKLEVASELPKSL